jgi:hypothetical protein
MTTPTSPNDDILAILRRFQAGYDARNPAQIDDFMRLFVEDDTLEVIGTSASGTYRQEWCLGVQAARGLFIGDWQHWGDLRLDLDAARLQSYGDVAWVSVPATVSQTLQARQGYAGYLDYVAELLAQDGDPLHKLLRIQLGCANSLYEYTRGEQFVWPLIITAVLTRSEGGANGGWRFRQMRFGFPTTRFPDERLV